MVPLVWLRATIRGYAREGTAPALRKAAAGIVLVVQDHIMMLMKM